MALRFEFLQGNFERRYFFGKARFRAASAEGLTQLARCKYWLMRGIGQYHCLIDSSLAFWLNCNYPQLLQRDFIASLPGMRMEN